MGYTCDSCVPKIKNFACFHSLLFHHFGCKLSSQPTFCLAISVIYTAISLFHTHIYTVCDQHLFISGDRDSLVVRDSGCSLNLR